MYAAILLYGGASGVGGLAVGGRAREPGRSLAVGGGGAVGRPLASGRRGWRRQARPDYAPHLDR